MALAGNAGELADEGAAMDRWHRKSVAGVRLHRAVFKERMDCTSERPAAPLEAILAWIAFEQILVIFRPNILIVHPELKVEVRLVGEAV